MHEALKTFLMSEPKLGGRKFMIDVRDGTVSISHLPVQLPGSARVTQYSFILNDKADNIASEAERIKAEILKDCLLSPPEDPADESKGSTGPYGDA